MRVIAGKYRGRVLVAPEGLNTRPILDRVKVSLFDWLGSLLDMPGTLPLISVLDIFCGGGSLGIEALSRGAASCMFVETDQAALKCLRTNLQTLQLLEVSRICESAAQNIQMRSAGADGFGLVFLDPPYRLSEAAGPGTIMGQLFKKLGTDVCVAAESLVLWRHDSRTVVPDNMEIAWMKDEVRTWGHMSISLFRKKTTPDE
jgi:16S rRNA (guanine966-N2)-methyltransferase